MPMWNPGSGLVEELNLRTKRENKPAYDRLWQERNREKVNAYNRASYHRRGLKARFGLTDYAYSDLLTQQGGVCKICGIKPNQRALSVDHDHTTGEVRGLLCSNCNAGLGMFKDSPVLLNKAKEYLEHSKGTKE